MTGRRMLIRPLIAPLAVCAVAAGFATRVAMRAGQLDALPVAIGGSLEESARPTARVSEAVDITPAVELDPFRPDRMRPPARYAVPGDAPPPVEEAAQATPSAITLVGTVTAPGDGSFAMGGIAGGAPRVIRVGQVVGDLTLKKVERGKAVFRSAAGEVVELTVPRAGH